MDPASASANANAKLVARPQQRHYPQIDWNLLLHEEQAGLFQLWVHFDDDLQFHRLLQNSLPYPAAIAMLKETENEVAIRQVLHPVANDVRLKYYIRTPSEPIYVLCIQHADTSNPSKDHRAALDISTRRGVSNGQDPHHAGRDHANIAEWEFNTYYGFDALRKKIEELKRAIKHHKFAHKLRVRVLLSGTQRDAILIRDGQITPDNAELDTDDDLPDLESRESAEDM
jgi:hypothetical protein